MAQPTSWVIRVKWFFILHWVKVLVCLVVLAALVWPAITLGRLDSYQRGYLMAFLSMVPIQAMIPMSS